MASSASTLTLVSCSTDKHAQGAITKRFSASACPLLLGRGARTALRDCERLDSPRFRLPATENDDRAQDDMAQSIISRRHAEVSFNDGRFAVRDSSTHGLSLVRAGLTMPVRRLIVPSCKIQSDMARSDRTGLKDDAGAAHER